MGKKKRDLEHTLAVRDALAVVVAALKDPTIEWHGEQKRIIGEAWATVLTHAGEVMNSRKRRNP